MRDIYCMFKVFRGYLVYQLCSIGPIVENNDKVGRGQLVVAADPKKNSSLFCRSA